MRNITFTPDAWEDYIYWQSEDKKTLRRINQLIRDTQRTPFEGIGKPEPLKGNLTGFWSRRIDETNTLVYEVHAPVFAEPRKPPVKALAADVQPPAMLAIGSPRSHSGIASKRRYQRTSCARRICSAICRRSFPDNSLASLMARSLLLSAVHELRHLFNNFCGPT
jgi:toxin YoeB